MIMKTFVWCIVSSTVLTVILGITDYQCETARPWQGTNVTCKCKTPNNINWQRNTVTFSTCTAGGLCSPKPLGYDFQTNISNSIIEYSLTVQKFDFSSCAVFSCRNIATSEQKNETLNVAVFNSTSLSVFEEPGDHKNGRIEITTECLFRATDIVVEWYSVNKDDKEEPYSPVESFKTPTDCTDTCNGEAAVTLNIGFTHAEGDKAFDQSVKLRLKVYHKEDTSNVLVITTVGQYNITGCWPWWLYLIIVLSVVLVLVLIGNILGCFILYRICCFESFFNQEGCNNCVDNCYCKCKCFDSTPCSACCNIKKLPFWYQILWASIVGIPIAIGIWVVWKCSKKGNKDTSKNAVGTGSNKKNAETKLLERKKPSKSPGKADDVNREKPASVKQNQHADQAPKVENEGKKPGRDLPPTPVGANPNREGSGSVVSGRDVEVQETDTSFKKSQLPNIHATGHDNKGRGLSANYSDDYHPLAGVDTPAQKAGALPTITDTPREEKKKTKKKKKEKQEEF